MSERNLVTATELARWIERGDCRTFDCRFDLHDAGAGKRAWLEGHIPGAVHADLDDDLAGPVGPGSGRHPLPEPEAFANFLARSGWAPGMPVVAYDAQSGAFAARLWWLMRYFGHPHAAILDGGFEAWKAEGLEVQSGPERPEPREPVELAPNPDMVLEAREVAAGLESGEITLVDARAADRFEGRNETIDPVAGHVPGARNHPFQLNVDTTGRFRSSEELRKSLSPLVPGDEPGRVAHMCGSGVTACHNLFAMELAGLSGSRLYAGSWSEWITDPGRPVALGSE